MGREEERKQTQMVAKGLRVGKPAMVFVLMDVLLDVGIGSRAFGDRGVQTAFIVAEDSIASV
jgi:hypothetical protein